MNKLISNLICYLPIYCIKPVVIHVRTTMIYTHTVKSVTLKEAKSPLDF